MIAEKLPDELQERSRMSRISATIGRTMGLNFPPGRWAELHRLIAAAASDLGFDSDLEACENWLAQSPAFSKHQFDLLVAHLTVGETYFFREQTHFDFLAERIIPELISRGERRLRIWSAGCCTGEEAYTIAMVLRRALPNLADWQVTLLATDINPRFLQKARAGIFGKWSFRDVPDEIKSLYFQSTPDGQFELASDIRRMVHFAQLNLVEDIYPSLLNEAHGMDVVFCRNVMMYFSPATVAAVVEKLYRAQRQGGWLFVGASEFMHLSSSPYTTIHAQSLVAYHKDSRPANNPLDCEVQSPRSIRERAVPSDPKPLELGPVPPTLPKDLCKIAMTHCAEGRYEEAIDLLQNSPSARTDEEANARVLTLLSRCLANQGKLSEALARCEQAITINKCDVDRQYLRAVILLEKGEIEEAAQALRRVLYLEPHYVLAHIALGSLARDRGQVSDARKHFTQAMENLQKRHPNSLISEPEAMTAGQLKTVVCSLLEAIS